MSIDSNALTGAELTLLHANQKLSMGSTLTTAEKLGAMGAAFAVQRSKYGPVPAEAEPVETPLPEEVKGAIADAHS